MPTVIGGARTSPKYEPLLDGAAERIHAAITELKDLGIIDENGNLLRTGLPDDMKPGADRDFGG